MKSAIKADTSKLNIDMDFVYFVSKMHIIKCVIQNLFFIPRIKTKLFSPTKHVTFNLIPFFMLFILVLPLQVMGALSCTNKSNYGAVPSGSAVSWSHTVSAGSDGYLVVHIRTVTVLTSSVTYNGVAMTNVVDYDASGLASGDGEWSVWQLASPATGAHTVAATMSTGTWDPVSCEAYSFTGSSGVGNTVNENTAGVQYNSKNIAISSNSMVIAVGYSGNLTSPTLKVASTTLTNDYTYTNGNTSFGAISASLSSGTKLIEGNTSGYTILLGIEVKETAVLPVEYSFLKAEFAHNHVKLNWQTTTETNNDYFIIQKSTNGSTWENDYRIEGAKNSTQNINYYFDDKTPYLGTSYYRIKQVDTDGKDSYSDIKTVNVDLIDHDEIHVSPNPTTGAFTIKGDLINIEDIRLFDVNGKDVTEHMKIQNSENEIHVDLEILNDGVYILKIKDSFSVKIDKI